MCYLSPVHPCCNVDCSVLGSLWPISQDKMVMLCEALCLFSLYPPPGFSPLQNASIPASSFPLYFDTPHQWKCASDDASMQLLFCERCVHMWKVIQHDKNFRYLRWRRCLRGHVPCLSWVLALRLPPFGLNPYPMGCPQVHAFPLYFQFHPKKFKDVLEIFRGTWDLEK